MKYIGGKERRVLNLREVWRVQEVGPCFSDGSWVHLLFLVEGKLCQKYQTCLLGVASESILCLVWHNSLFFFLFFLEFEMGK